jgi:hypothetical protein
LGHSESHEAFSECQAVLKDCSGKRGTAQTSTMESNGDQTMSDSELQSTKIMQDEITPVRVTNWDDKASRTSDRTSVSNKILVRQAVAHDSICEWAWIKERSK